MPIGEIQFSPQFKYSINADHANGDTAVIDVVMMDFGNPEDPDAPAQSLVDILNAHPDWTVTGASKSMVGQAEITPTPPE